MAKRRFRLIPREESFYDLFVKQAESLVQGSELLHDIVTNFDDVPAKARRLHDIEHEADEATHEVMRRLNTTFVTPIDREDIHELASSLDDVMDHMDAAADLLVLHKIEKPLPEMRTQADLLHRGSQTTLEAMRALPHFDQLEHYWVEINRLENEADRLLRDELAALFEGGTDAIEVIKWKELYETMEAVTDRCEDVLNVIEGITLKMA